MLVTGGGGYSNPDAARAWCEATRGLLSSLSRAPIVLLNEVPEHEYLNEYAADGYSMVVDPGKKEDENLRTVEVRVRSEGEEGAERMRYLDYLIARAEEDLKILMDL